MPKVVFWHMHLPAMVDVILQNAPPGLEMVAARMDATEDAKIELTRDADFVLLQPDMPFTERMLRECRRLKLVQILGAGYDKLDLPLMARYGVPVATVPGANAWAVAEHTVGLLLALCKRLTLRDQEVRRGLWRQRLASPPHTFELAGKTVGYVGMGAIGSKVARRLAAFETRGLYTKRHRLSPQEEQELGVAYVSLDDLLRQADVVTLHCNLTPETRGLIGARELALMKPGAVLINTARGQVVDEAALAEALQEGRLAGAGLDVFDPEPVSGESPLLRLDNVVLSPHSAFSTPDTLRRYATAGYANLQRVWQGQPPHWVITPSA